MSKKKIICPKSYHSLVITIDHQSEQENFCFYFYNCKLGPGIRWECRRGSQPDRQPGPAAPASCTSSRPTYPNSKEKCLTDRKDDEIKRRLYKPSLESISKKGPTFGSYYEDPKCQGFFRGVGTMLVQQHSKGKPPMVFLS
jgi:hypothetical protein